jgi:hypothetical protein
MNIDLAETKAHNKGIRSLVTADGLLIVVIDLTKPIGTSSNGNPVFATTNGFTGLPCGNGVFLNMVVGKKECQK